MKIWQRWLLLLIFGPPCFIIVGAMCGYMLDEFTQFTGPTPDQQYGCTVKQQSPNGYCP